MMMILQSTTIQQIVIERASYVIRGLLRVAYTSGWIGFDETMLGFVLPQMR